MNSKLGSFLQKLTYVLLVKFDLFCKIEV